MTIITTGAQGLAGCKTHRWGLYILILGYGLTTLDFVVAAAREGGTTAQETEML